MQKLTLGYGRLDISIHNNGGGHINYLCGWLYPQSVLLPIYAWHQSSEQSLVVLIRHLFCILHM